MLEKQLEAMFLGGERPAGRTERRQLEVPWKDGAETGLYCGLCAQWCAEVAGHYRSP